MDEYIPLKRISIIPWYLLEQIHAVCFYNTPVTWSCIIYKDTIITMYLFACRYLIDKGANVAAVNIDGELPIDISEGDDMEQLLQEEMERNGNVNFINVNIVELNQILTVVAKI